VLDGIQPFQVWDETHVHTKINPDKTVLMERVDDSGREPWTWVREQGKGRVFYTGVRPRRTSLGSPDVPAARAQRHPVGGRSNRAERMGQREEVIAH
jgi:type 1 glutamine amidotransferase